VFGATDYRLATIRIIAISWWFDIPKTTKHRPIKIFHHVVVFVDWFLLVDVIHVVGELKQGFFKVRTEINCRKAVWPTLGEPLPHRVDATPLVLCCGINIKAVACQVVDDARPVNRIRNQRKWVNLRQNLSFESFRRVIGTKADEVRFAEFQGTPEEVICGDDYFVFDSTLASEKGFMAQSLQELLGIILSNPMASQQFDISAQALLEEIQRLRGGGNISRFSLSARVAAGKEAPPMPIQPEPTSI